MATNDPGTLSTRSAAVLAWVSAALYALIVLGIPYPDLGVQRAMFALAAIGYLGGGLLLWRGVGTRLLLVGTIANAVVMLVWLLRAASGASPLDGFAIVTKAVEIGLEVLLVAALWTRSRARDIPTAQGGTPS